jgi:hypothetical protein
LFVQTPPFKHGAEAQGEPADEMKNYNPSINQSENETNDLFAHLKGIETTLKEVQLL